MDVRPATHEDVAGIRRVASAAYEAAYPAVLGADRVAELLEEWYSPSAVEESIDHPESRTFVAVDSGTVVGFASAGADPGAGVGTLGSLYVHPDHWGDGIGTRLLEQGGASLLDRGIDRLRIHVFEENDVGVSFYEDRARRVDREIHEIRGLSVPVLVFERDLD